ncbi:MAG: alpha/beta hydrolase [Bacteroidota bacterium]
MNLKFLLFMLLSLCLIPVHAQTEVFLGSWEGPLNAGGTSIRIVFHIGKAADGGWKASMDSPDQGAKGFPVETIVITEDSLNLSLMGGAIQYEGVKEGDQIMGTFTQGGQDFGLNLRLQTAERGPDRPQTPQAPFPYKITELVIRHEAAGLDLAGTLTVPQSEGPHPLAILLTGSGQQDRNSTIMEHQPFWVIADHLSRNGIAVWRMDDRGVGGSGGNPGLSTTADFAADAIAALSALKGRPEIDAERIGLIGHSEGGMIAQIAAANQPDVAFVILLASPGVAGRQLLGSQESILLKNLGINQTTLDKWKPIREKVYDIAIKGDDPRTAWEEMEKMLNQELTVFSPEEMRQLGLSPSNLQGKFLPLLSPWYRYFLAFSPDQYLPKIHAPVLALNGEKDQQVPATENLAALGEGLSAGGNTQVELKPLPNLNHLFQNAPTGSPTEYGSISETFAPTALEEMMDWLKRQMLK